MTVHLNPKAYRGHWGKFRRHRLGQGASQAPQAPQAIQLKGMVTWTKVKVLNNNNPLTYLYTSNIYDDKGRVIQVQKQNISASFLQLSRERAFYHCCLTLTDINFLKAKSF